MDELIRKFLEAGHSFEPLAKRPEREHQVVYPTPKSLFALLAAEKRSQGMPEEEIQAYLQELRDYQAVLHVMDS